MLDEPFRARFSHLALPLVRVLERSSVTPNDVTVVSFGLGVAAATLVATGFTYAGLGLWLTSRVGDGLDGALARATHRSSPFGGYLDITLDMAAYSAMVVAFARLHPHLMTGWTFVLAGYVLVITTTLALSNAALLAGRQVSETDRTFQFTPGFAEAGETNIMYTLWVVLPDQTWWLVWVWVALLAATVVQRTYLAARVFR